MSSRTEVNPLNSSSSFRPFRPHRQVAGYVVPTLRANFVAIVDTRRIAAEHFGLEGEFNESIRDYLYMSVVSYTSLGYGDIWPTGHLRTICGFEALTGILMMAWSAAYTVSRLQELWHDDT